jgi:glucose-6-phosphate-specific signal transduction histidine kinase
MRIAQQVPSAVRVARTMWIVAIGAGVFETVLVLASGRAGDGYLPGVIIRAVVFTGAALVVRQMFAGRRWARLALTLALGVVGTLSLVVSPLLWLAGGGSLGPLVQRSGVIDLLFGGSRVVHVTAVLSACALMFVPSANRYFRTAAGRPG